MTKLTIFERAFCSRPEDAKLWYGEWLMRGGSGGYHRMAGRLG